MRAVIQRVSKASVISDGELTGKIALGLVILLGIEETDNQEDVEWLCNKIINMRIFSDDEGLMNLSVMDVKGELMVVSQFTLHAKTKKGNRPSFIRSARTEQAIPLYESFKSQSSSLIGKEVAAGVFGADMKIELVNDGPVTIILDSRNRE